MNNTKNILLVAIIAATMVMGTSVIPMQSYADRDDNGHKKTKDFVSSITASAESDKKSSSQHQDQDNFCYRGDNDCEQANEGQQLAGKDNEATGFNDQSDNLDLSAIGTGIGNATGNATGNGNGGTPQQRCELCLLNVDLAVFFSNTVVRELGIDNNADLCAALAAGTLSTVVLGLLLEALDIPTVQCLIAAGINLPTRTPEI